VEEELARGRGKILVATKFLRASCSLIKTVGYLSVLPGPEDALPPI
jgi:hypothetical protein